MTPHIAFVITRGDAIGGATIHVRDMARTLMDRGLRATVLMGGGGAAARAMRSAGIPLITLSHLGRSIHPLRDALAIHETAQVLRALKPHLVSTHTAKAGIVGRVAGRMARIPVLFTPHGWAISNRISPVSGRIFRLAERLAAPLASTIVNVCDAERALALAHGIAPQNKLAVVHNGVADIPAALLAHPAAEPVRIAMVARFEAPKDHAALLRSLAELRALPWELEFIGEGPSQLDTRMLAVRLGIADRVDFAGSCGDVAGHLSRCQIFALTSRSEGFPRSILEAMRAGLPVVASNVGGIAEAVVNGENGFVVPASSPAALTEALRTLIANPGLRASFGRKGREFYETRFTFDLMYAKTVALYSEILRRPFESAAEVKGGAWRPLVSR